MKTLKALLMVALMGASVAAMAEGGGDRVMARMVASRDAAMAHYQQSEHATAVASAQKDQQSEHATAVASAQKASSNDVQRSN